MNKILILTTIVLLSSCGSSYRLNRFKKFAYNDKNKTEVAKVCNDLFPCIETEIEVIKEVVKEVEIIIGDSIECPTVVINPAKPNEIIKPIKVKCPDIEVVKEIEYITTTKTIKDTREIEVLKKEIKDVTDKNNELKSNLEIEKDKVKRKNKTIVILYIILGVYFAYKVLKIYIKSKKLI